MKYPQIKARSAEMTAGTIQLRIKSYINQLIQLTRAEIYQKMLKQSVRKRYFIKITHYCYFL